MRTRIVSLAVIGSMLCSAPAFAQSEVEAEPKQEWIHGALLGGIVIPVGVATTIYLQQGCPKSGFAAIDCMAGPGIGLALMLPGGLLGGLIEWLCTNSLGGVTTTTATLIPSTNGRDAVSLHLLVRF